MTAVNKADQISALKEINSGWGEVINRETCKMCSTLVVTDVKKEKANQGGKNAKAGQREIGGDEDNVSQEFHCEGKGQNGGRWRGSGVAKGLWVTGRKYHMFKY